MTKREIQIAVQMSIYNNAINAKKEPLWRYKKILEPDTGKLFNEYQKPCNSQIYNYIMYLVYKDLVQSFIEP